MIRMAVTLIMLVWLVLPGTSNAQIVEPGSGIDTAAARIDTGAGDSTASTCTTTVYYFHGQKRCATCRKIEALSERSLRDKFESELSDSTLVWRVVNFETKDNAHYAERYGLFSQTLIVSRYCDGAEVRWVNLDKIWQLVHDEGAFLTYVQNAVAADWERGPNE